MTTKIQIHGASGLHHEDADVALEKTNEKAQPLEAAIDHAMKVIEILNRRIKEKDRKYHLRFSEMQRINNSLLRQLHAYKAEFSFMMKRLNSVESKDYEISHLELERRIKQYEARDTFSRKQSNSIFKKTEKH